jgi:hypothetical protein
MAGRSAKHTAFRGWVSSSTAKWRALVWGDDAGGVSEHVSKLRIRAIDGYSKASDWVVSNAFTVEENAYPTIALVGLAEGGLLTGNTPLLSFDVADADDDALHVEVMLSVRPDFVGAVTANSATDQTGWEEAADPYETWSDVPSAGATAGNRVRWQAPPLRYDWYYLRARVSDGILTSAWLPTIRVLVTPSGAMPLTCTIGDTAYYISGLVAAEKTGGEASPMEFDIALPEFNADPFARGASVSVGLVIGEQSRTWNGTVETTESRGANMHIFCLQDDRLFSHIIVPGDLATDDLGANLAAMIDTYGSPLDSTYMDTSLGLDAAIVGDYKTLCSHLQEWAELMGFLFWADSLASVHLVMPADLADPVHILREEYVT